MYVPTCVYPFMSMPLPFLCLLRVYVSFMCMSFCVCVLLCIYPFQVYVSCMYMSLRTCLLLYVCPFRVYAPPFLCPFVSPCACCFRMYFSHVCPSVHIYVPSSVCLPSCDIISVCMSSSYVCSSVCMSLRVYVTFAHMSLLYISFMCKYFPFVCPSVDMAPPCACLSACMTLPSICVRPF